MIRTIRTLFPMAALVLLPLACAAPTDEPDSLASPVADGVYQFNAGTHNAFFVDTDGGVVAFDPISTEAAAGLATAIRGVAPDKRLAAIVYSHSDADHATGAPVLQQEFGGDVPIIAQENAFPIITERGNPDLPPPDVTFADELTLRFGGARDRTSLSGTEPQRQHAGGLRSG